MLCLYRCAEITVPYHRTGTKIVPAISRHVSVWTNYQNPAVSCQYVLAEGSAAQFDAADVDPDCTALSARVADKSAFRAWLTQPIGGALAALQARCEADRIPTQDLTAADTRGKALRRILRTIEAAQVLWGLRKTPAFATAIELLRADPLSTIGDLSVDVRQKAQAWFDNRGIDVSDLTLATPLWMVVRRVCDTLTTQSAFGETDPTDTFSGADESPIATNWTSGQGAWGDINLLANQPRASAAATECAARYDISTFSLDHYSQVTIGNFIDGIVAPLTRMRADADGDCYCWESFNDNGSAGTSFFALFRFDDTGALTPVQLGSNVAELGATGDLVKLTSSGTTHTGYRNGVQKIQQTDATYNTGGTHISLGFRCFAASTAGDARISAWTGADLGSAVITGTVTSNINEVSIVAGGKTIIATLTGDTFVPLQQNDITFVGSQTGGFAGTTTNQNITFNLANGIAATPSLGDMVIVTYGIGALADRTLSIKNNNATIEYTLMGSELYSNDTFDANLRAAFRFMVGTADTRFVLGCDLGGTGNIQSAGAYSVHVFRGVDSTTPMDVAVVTNSNVNGHNVLPGTITPGNNGAVMYASGVGAMGTAAAYTSTDMNSFVTTATSDTQDCVVGAGYRAWNNNGAYVAIGWGGGGTNNVSDSWASVFAALRSNVNTPFNNSRQTFINAINSKQGEAHGWNNEVRAKIAVTDVVRTNNTVATITLDAEAAYDITANENIVVTLPASILTGNANIVATPEFRISLVSSGPSPLAADSGSYLITGTAATLTATRLLSAVSGVYLISGTAAGLARVRPITGVSGSYLISGTAAGLRATRLISAASGIYLLSGSTAALKSGRMISAASGVYLISGTAAQLRAGRLISAGSGLYLISGKTAGLLVSRLISADSGVYLLSGTDAGLIVASANPVLSAEGGVYLISGFAAGLSQGSTSGFSEWLITARRRGRR